MAGLDAMNEDEDLLTGSEDYPASGDDSTASGVGALSALDMPGAQDAIQRLIKSSNEARAALQQARTRISARKYNRGIALLSVAGALGQPTRAGSSAEGWANAANALAGQLQNKEAFEGDQEKQLLGIDTQMAGLDQNTATAELQLAALRAKLANQSANSPLEKVVVPGKANPVGMTRAEARGKELYVPPPPPNFTITQQPLPDGTVVPVKVDHRTGNATPVGEAYVPQSKLSGSAKLQAEGKLQTVQILKEQLKDIRDKWSPLKDSLSAGKYQGWWPSEAGSNFDKAVAAARGTIRQLTRVPGEGSMSDWEGKLDQAKLPDRNDYESSTLQSMDQLEKLIDAYERTTKDMLGFKATIKFDKSGKRVQ